MGVGQHALQRRKLLREGEDGALLQHITFGFQALDQLRHQALLQLLIQRGESRHRIVRRRSARRCVLRKGEAPDLIAVILGQGLETFVEAANEVGLGHQHIHRRTHAQFGLQFVQTSAQLGGVLLALGGALLQQVLDVDGEQHTVDGLARQCR